MQHWASLGQRRRPSDGTLNGNKTYAHSFFPWKHCVGLKACAESERERERDRDGEGEMARRDACWSKRRVLRPWAEVLL